VPSRKEIHWSQLKVGALVIVAMAVLIGLIFLMSGTTGGLFAEKFLLRSYFENAAGLKNGAPVTLQGVTIGNVVGIRIVPARNPTPVEVTMQVGREAHNLLHSDSKASIAQAGVLGDSYVDIDSTLASGPPPGNNAELETAGSPSIQDVIRTSEDSIKQVQRLTVKIDTLFATLNTSKGTLGTLINDPQLAKKIVAIATNLQTTTNAIANGNGTLGKFVNDPSLYNHALAAVDQLDKLTADLQAGKGSAGRLLKDESLYNNLNEAVASSHELVAGINSGKGGLGKLAADPAFAQKLDDTVTHLDAILKGVDAGEGTVGQLMKSRTLYEHTDQAMDDAHQLLQAFRQNPKKYLVIQMKIF
jgi:phospholipid/cholesterol/gamma-HCH transport system substrate-binding protein